MLRFDLQSHSVYSDGALAPAEVVAAASGAGVELLALSDHDSVDGVPEAMAAGREHGVRVVPAVEISAGHGDAADLHILGYGLDPADGPLLAALERSRADRLTRAERMSDALRELGWVLDEAALEARRASGASLGRPHLAEAVFSPPANAERLRREGLSNPSRVLEAYLIPGAPAYRARTRPTVAEAIEMIHGAGGVAVWAHPFWDFTDPDQVVETLRRFHALGIDGLEAFYITHDADQTRVAATAAAELGLLRTGSSDFHGPQHPRFHRFLAHEFHGLAPQLGPIAS